MKNFKILLIFICFLSLSCPMDTTTPTRYETKYPSSLTVNGVGTLKYIQTLWDQSNTKNKKGIDFYYAVLIDDIIWIYTSDNGGTLFKGINKSASKTIKYPNINDLSVKFMVDNNILAKGNYAVFFLNEHTEIYPYYNNEFYIARVNRITMEREYIKLLFNATTTRDKLLRYFSTNNLFLKAEDQAGNKYYMINNDCDGIIEISEVQFNNDYTPKPDFEKDSSGRHYRVRNYSNKLEVSFDNGVTWYYNDMGTNEPRGVIVQNDLIYVFCNQISESIDVFHNEFLGGGIHVFKWE